MYCIKLHFNRTFLFKNNFLINQCFTFLSLCLLSHAAAQNKIALNDKLDISYGLDFKGNTTSGVNSMFKGGDVDHHLDNQATSGEAYKANFLSARLGLNLKNVGELQTRFDYYWTTSSNYSLFLNSYSKRRLLLRDFYVKIHLLSPDYSIWAGKRTFEFDDISAFQIANPFNQIGLIGVGIDSSVFQIAVAVNKETVLSKGKDLSGNYILDANGTNILYSNDDYLATLFMSGRFILSEGKIFQPIFSLRYYRSYQKDNIANVKKELIYSTSSMIIGGVYLRPLNNGVKGTTTIWFSTYPYNGYDNSNAKYLGENRVSLNYPQNIIGFSDSSEFMFTKKFGLITGIIILNNTYSKDLAVLKITDDKSRLSPNGTETSRNTNRVGIVLQPLVFLTENIYFGLDTNLNYVSKKLIETDANSFIVTPLIKYVFDSHLQSKNYFYLSLNYGLYDWNIKELPDDRKTRVLLTTQTGVSFNF